LWNGGLERRIENVWSMQTSRKTQSGNASWIDKTWLSCVSNVVMLRLCEQKTFWQSSIPKLFPFASKCVCTAQLALAILSYSLKMKFFHVILLILMDLLHCSNLLYNAWQQIGKMVQMKWNYIEFWKLIHANFYCILKMFYSILYSSGCFLKV